MSTSSKPMLTGAPSDTAPKPVPLRVDTCPWPEIDRLDSTTAIDFTISPSWYTAGKVLLDYSISILLLPVALIAIGIAAVVVKCTSTGPAFYTQTRVGIGGRRYKILKIRTMYHNCEARSGIRWAAKQDDRITPIGRFLRATHIDELPQLFNVLMGEMSLVGPRPERPEVIQAKGLEQVVPGYRHRLMVKPGVTGFAQLQLPADSDINSVRRKVVYDLYYVQHQSLLLDLRLIIGTIMKACGTGPQWLQRLFFLPSRDRVADEFRGNIVGSKPDIIARLQPA